MDKYKRLIRRAKRSVEYWTQLAIRDFVRELNVRLEVAEMNRAQLAEKIDVSAAYVSKVMRGDVNFTLETMTKLAMATGGRVHVSLIPMPNDGQAEVLARGSWRAVLGSGGAAAAFEHVRDINFQTAANDQWLSAKASPTMASAASARECA